MPDVTVVTVATADYEHWLEQAVASIRRQTAPVEIAVVSYGLTKRWADRQVEVGPAGFTLASAWNHAVGVVTTPYVVCLEADNVLADDYVEQLLHLADAKTIVTPGYMHNESESLPPIHCVTASALSVQNAVVNAALFPRAAWDYLGGFREIFYYDWDFWYRAARAGYRIRTVQSPLLRLRPHPESLTQQAIRRNTIAAHRREFFQANWLPGDGA